MYNHILHVICGKEQHKEETMEEIVRLTIRWLVPFVLGTIATSIIGIIKKDRKKDKAIENAVQALLRNELIRRYREYKIKGEMTILDKENIEHMFEEYKNLGGNGTVKELMDELLEVPTKIVKL